MSRPPLPPFTAETAAHWGFDGEGLTYVRHASINDVPIDEADRKHRWPLGRRPDDHASLSDLRL